MMKELFAPDAPILIQGITGKEGSRMTGWLKKSGSKILAGVTPGKGGTFVDEIPVFNSVAEACAQFPEIKISSIVVPPLHVQAATLEALAAGIKFIHILTEQVPVHQIMKLRAAAATANATILGPASVGLLQFPRWRIGYCGGENPFEYIIEGDIAIVSASGGMTNELIMALHRAGLGIKVALAVGGGLVAGTTMNEAVEWVKNIPEVKKILIFVEPGSALLAAAATGQFKFNKPTVVLLAGEALELLPRGLPYGHTGTILGEDAQSLKLVREQINQQGTPCVNTINEAITILKNL